MASSDHRVHLGDRVRDRITGFEGIVIGITDWLYQCRRPIVQPQMLDNGKTLESQSFDEDQLQILEAGAYAPKPPQPKVESKTGGPAPTPTRQSTPTRR